MELAKLKSQRSQCQACAIENHVKGYLYLEKTYYSCIKVTLTLDLDRVKIQSVNCSPVN